MIKIDVIIHLTKNAYTEVDEMMYVRNLQIIASQNL